MLLDVEGLAFVVLFMFWIWALLDCVATDSAVCRNLPKPMWILIVLFLPDIGSLLWVLLGRPEKASWRPGSVDYASPRRPIGPEDAPRYSATPIITDRRSKELDAELERWEREKSQPKDQPDLDEWRRDLDRRELELRQRELEKRERDLGL
jgi:hypothetical protein